MNLVASLIVKDELGRYLEQCVNHLLEFCDEIAVVDDRSTDGTGEWLGDRAQLRRGIHLRTSEVEPFFAHEGRARQELLEHTLARQPSHVLVIDADELVGDGTGLRAQLEQFPNVDTWRLCMEEVWKATPQRLYAREDGEWYGHEVTAVYRVPEQGGRRHLDWRMPDKQLACGRTPLAAARMRVSRYADVSLFHFGWACAADRQARYERYVLHDGGRFHRNAHLLSIMWPDERVELESCPWPEALKPYRAAIVKRAGRKGSQPSATTDDVDKVLLGHGGFTDDDRMPAELSEPDEDATDEDAAPPSDPLLEETIKLMLEPIE